MPPLSPETTPSDAAAAERQNLQLMLRLLACEREIAPEPADDERYALAAKCLRSISRTLPSISDATLLKLASVNATSQGNLVSLIRLHAETVGFQRGRVASAVEFFAPIEAQVDEILATARRAMN